MKQLENIKLPVWNVLLCLLLFLCLGCRHESDKINKNHGPELIIDDQNTDQYDTIKNLDSLIEMFEPNSVSLNMCLKKNNELLKTLKYYQDHEIDNQRVRFEIVLKLYKYQKEYYCQGFNLLNEHGEVARFLAFQVFNDVGFDRKRHPMLNSGYVLSYILENNLQAEYDIELLQKIVELEDSCGRLD